ncbi:MAG: SPOR domain-containing protein, partial [Pseudomonadota bacterium]
GSTIVRGVRIEQSLPGEVELTIEWSGEHSFVVTPTTDAHGIRLRILDVFAAAQGAVTVKPLDELMSGYAINVDSATTPFDPAAVDAAAANLKTPLHVSTVELAGETWYRLRAGPIGSRSDAQRLLAVAREHFPRAWMGVADEPAAVEVVLPPSADLAPTVATDPALSQKELTALQDEARRALSKRDLPRAVELLTKLTRQPEFSERARAQEMLGLARERSGQLAHAKAEYEEYLRRYPRGDAVSRVRARLRTLAGAHRVARNGMLIGTDEADRSWRIDGGASQLYRWERSELTTAQTDARRQDQNALYTDADMVARRRGERFDFVSRLSAGYAHDMLTEGPGSKTRVSSAFVELNDRTLGVAARLGRQSRNSGGLLGTFDGLFGSYQLRPRIALNAAVGLPVESTREAPQSDRRFVGVSADFGPFRDKLDIGAFAVVQQLAGETDRRAVGVEARYFVPGRTLLAMIDYDAYYQEINSAVLTGSLRLPARWTVSFSGDHRRAPVLTTRNALIGQPVQNLEELLGLFAPSEVEQLARDRTPLSDLFSLSVSRPLGERFQFSFEVYGSRFAETVASGNVAATPASGLETTFQVQLTANNLGQANDLWVLSARYQNGALATIESIALATRLPIGGAWRLGPRLRVDRRDSVVDAARETLYVPTLRLDYLHGRTWLECEAGAEFGQRLLATDDESSRRYYFGLGYRLNF